MEHEIKEILAWFTGYGFGPTDIVGVLSVVAAFLPPHYRGAAAVIIKLINMGAFNFLQAENKKKPGEKS